MPRKKPPFPSMADEIVSLPTETTLSVSPGSALANIPSVIAESGRVKGFERLRDTILELGEALGLSWDKVVKMVLEVDRHALAAVVAAEKYRREEDQERMDWFQHYLEGEVEMDTSPDNVTQRPKQLRRPVKTEESARRKPSGKAEAAADEAV